MSVIPSPTKDRPKLKKVFGFNQLEYRISRKWFIFWLIDNFRPSGIEQKELLPFIAEASRQMQYLLLWFSEPSIEELCNQFVESGYLKQTGVYAEVSNKQCKESIKFFSIEAGRKELERLKTVVNLEEQLGQGYWDELKLNLPYPLPETQEVI